MKSKFLWLGFCGMLLLSSCSSKSASSENDSISDSNVTDSTQVDEPQETQEEPTYLSADLKKFGLKGQVKKVTIKTSNEFWMPGYVFDTLVFDELGNLTSKLADDFKIKVNDDGFIYKIVDRMGASDGSQVDADYTIDENGWPVKLKYVLSGPEEGNANLTFTYPEVDDHGNWIKCIAKGTIVNIDPETEDALVDKVNETFTRVITY